MRGPLDQPTGDPAPSVAADGPPGSPRTESTRALRLAHRGDHRSASENSLEALHAALAVPGVHGVEFDVRASADGVAILLHVPTLERVHGRPEAAAELSAAELARSGVRPLTLALAAVPEAAFRDIEVKADCTDQVVEAVRAARGDRPEGVVLSSFEPDVLARLGALAPSWPRWLNALHLDEATISLAIDLGCRGVSVDWTALDAASIGAAQAAGLEVVAWTVRDPRTAERLDALGVVAQCVEGPALDE